MTGAFIKNRYRRAIEMIGHALTLGNEVDIWLALATVLKRLLTAHELRLLLAALARAADPDDALEVFECAAPQWLSGGPLPVFDDIDSEARWWADMATVAELKAWLAAIFVRLPERERQAFLAAASRRAVA